MEFHTEIRAAIKKHSGEELDIKPYEADMRHLINTYIQADPAAELGQLGDLSLTELIIETGIHDAIASKLNEKGKLSKNAIAEGIINNVRKTIIRDQLTDPRFYEQMSLLLDDLIQQNRADTAAYEEFLRKAEALVKRLAAKHPEAGVPAALHGKHEAIVIYNNLPRSWRPQPRRPLSPSQTRLRTEAASWRSRSTARCASRHRRAGRATRRARRRCSTRSSRCSTAIATATLALFELVKNQPVTDEETIQLGEIAIARDAQGHQARPSLGASAERAGHAGRTDRHAPGGRPRLRDLQAGLDPRPAGEAARAGARDAAPVRRARESLPLGPALPAVRDRAEAEAVRDARSPAHHAHRATRQRSGEAGGGDARLAQALLHEAVPATDPQVGAAA